MTVFMLDDVIGGWDGVQSHDLRDWLAANKGAKELTVRVNSPGGDAFEGMSMYAALKASGARIVAVIEGMAASAASIVVMAADEIHMNRGSQLMIHDARGFVFGTAEQLESRATMLRTINSEAADIYAARTGQTRDKCVELMSAETWMAANEAKSLGFCDVVIEAKAKASATKHSGTRQQAFMASAFKHIPGDITDRFLASPSAQQESDDMNEEQILKALGFASIADLQAATMRLRQLETASGVAGDECVGLLRAALTSHTDALPKAQARIAELEKSGQAHELTALFAQAEKDKKLTPAIKDGVQAAFDAGQVTLEGAKAWLANLLPVAALAAAPKSAAAPASATVAPVPETHNGKSYGDMTGLERVALKKENPELYASMRAAHLATRPGKN